MMQDLKVIPNELLSHIATYLNKEDLASMRLVNKRTSGALQHVFGLSIVENRTIYPRYASISAFFLLLNSNPSLSAFVRSVTLVGEGIKEHEYGHLWAWERMTEVHGVRMTMDDLNILDEVEFEHLRARDLDQAFVHGGGYRTMLGKYHTDPGVLHSIFTSYLAYDITVEYSWSTSDIDFG
jgi:hypothetical protein